MADRIYVEIEGADSVLADFVAKPGQIKRAARRAVLKAVRGARTKIARELATEHQLPLSLFVSKRAAQRRTAFFVTRDTGADVVEGGVWIGSNPIQASYLGKLSQGSAGTTVSGRSGKHFFEHAFIRSFKSGHVGVLKRIGRGRYPIEPQTVRLAMTDSIISRVANGIPQRLSELLHQELNNEINVRGKG